MPGSHSWAANSLVGVAVLIASIRNTVAFSPHYCSPALQQRQYQKRHAHFVPDADQFVSLGASTASTAAADQLINGESPSGALFGRKGKGENDDLLSGWQSAIVKAGMMLYIVSMCLALPLTLLPQELIYRLKLINKQRKEYFALRTAQFCARWLLRIIPFCRLTVVSDFESKSNQQSQAEPAIWVCNHTSMLDVFLLLASDKRLRGKHGRRPIKVVYWKGLEANPISKLLFQQAGFISVQMEANKAGESNEYNRASFKKLLKDAKEAFEEGFDLGVFPEGQLNPTPERGLLPVFNGAYTLARMSRRPIYMMALSGAHRLWHPSEDIGMKPTSRRVKVRCYGKGRAYQSPEDFLQTFENVVGTFAITGEDLPEDELNAWLDGTKISLSQSESS